MSQQSLKGYRINESVLQFSWQIKVIIKAGMTGLDKEKINQIIENASKGSKFYAKQKENQARSEYKIIVWYMYINLIK